MTRLSFFLTTLIAAIPAAFLAYLCVAAFLFHSGDLSAILMGVAGITLLLCVAVIAMPAWVLLKMRGRPAAAEKPAEKASDEAVEDDALASEESAVATADEGEDVFVEGGADEFDDFDDTPRKK